MRFILLAFLISLSARAAATGCDCSCFGYEETIQASDTHYASDFKLERDGNKLKVVPLPGRYNKLTDPIWLTGYDRHSPIHPRLIDRLLAEKAYLTLTRMNVTIAIEPEYGCEDGPTTARTGRYRLEVEFLTGETVTLFNPTRDDLVERDWGKIKFGNLLPLPLEEEK